MAQTVVMILGLAMTKPHPIHDVELRTNGCSAHQKPVLGMQPQLEPLSN